MPSGAPKKREEFNKMDKNKMLFNHVKNNNKMLSELLLISGVDPNECQFEEYAGGGTYSYVYPLVYAIKNENLYMVTMLLYYGEKVQLHRIVQDFIPQCIFELLSKNPVCFLIYIHLIKNLKISGVNKYKYRHLDSLFKFIDLHCKRIVLNELMLPRELNELIMSY